MADQGKLLKELWRLRVNGFLSEILMGIMFSICTTDFITSFHRFVTNPKKESTNGTSISFKAEPGLGESEFFYSVILTIFNGTATFSALLVGVLLRCVPYWYQYIFFLFALVFGSVLYGIANQVSTLLVSMAIIGLFVGSESALGNNYAIKLSNKYFEVLKKRGDDSIDVGLKVKIRNYLYTAHSFRQGVGFIIGTGIGVLFSHLPIEQYRSTSWFNVACGLALLFVFVFFFRGESKSDCLTTNTQKSNEMNIKKNTNTLGALQIFIVCSFLLLNFIQALKWVYFDVLLNPILSDSFGISLEVSSYFYLGIAVPRFLGPVGVAVLQKMKFSSQFILIIGFLLSTTAYALLTDWQAIPYDPCTEYSPFHHPEQFKNQSIVSLPLSSHKLSLNIHSDIRMQIGNKRLIDGDTRQDILYTCKRVVFCKSNTNMPTIDLNFHNFTQEIQKSVLYCHVPVSKESDFNNKLSFCVNLIQDKTTKALDESVTIQRLMVLPDNIYARASNSCMNALDGQCHWIPFSTITGKKCEDCPPICRGKHQTLSLAQVVIGLCILILANPFEWIPLLAMISNQLSNNKKILGFVLGAMNAIMFISMFFGPIIADPLYEVTQKRTYVLSILLGSLNIPFLIEVFVLYRHLGPGGSTAEALNTQRKKQNN